MNAASGACLGHDIDILTLAVVAGAAGAAGVAGCTPGGRQPNRPG